MPIEAWALSESEKKKKELSDKQINDNNNKILQHKKIKEKISINIESDERLASFRELISQWVVSNEVVKKIIAGENIDDEIINEMFEKIDQIEDIKNIDKYLPDDLRITREDYKKALTDDIFRVQTLTKLDTALTILANHISWDSTMWINLFSWFLTMLDKNLILIQDNTIDLKDNLHEIDEKKFWKKIDSRSLWQKFVDFLKELFSSNNI